MEEEIIKLQEKIAESEKKSEEYLAGWKRERADFINYKKEEMERISGLIKYANEEIILNFLPILDNLFLAEAHLKDPGITMITKQFLDLLKKEGIEPVETTGKVFDPNTMEVIEEVENNDGENTAESGTVAEEMQKGYLMHGKLIRPAKIKVIK